MRIHFWKIYTFLGTNFIDDDQGFTISSMISPCNISGISWFKDSIY